MDEQVQFILQNYGSLLEKHLGTKNFAFGFYPNSESYADRVEPIEQLSDINGRNITFFQDFSYQDKVILSDYNVCYIDNIIFVKIVTPFIFDRCYDFIVTKKEDFRRAISLLKRNEGLKDKNNKIDFPLIGLDFDFFKREIIDFLLNDKFREYCKKKNIKLKRGLIFEGPPGCSKSLTLTWIKRQARLNDIEFHSFENPKEFIENKERYFDASKKSIFAFEDFDAFLREREDTDNSPNQILSTILNTLDGIDEIENIVSIFTTNRVNTFDSAFIRPGRIDKVIRFSPPSDRNIFEFFDAYIPEYDGKEKSILFEYIKENSKLISYALLKGICDDINIAMFNNQENKISIDDILKLSEVKITGANKNTVVKSSDKFIL